MGPFRGVERNGIVGNSCSPEWNWNKMGVPIPQHWRTFAFYLFLGGAVQRTQDNQAYEGSSSRCIMRDPLYRDIDMHYIHE